MNSDENGGLNTLKSTDASGSSLMRSVLSPSSIRHPAPVASLVRYSLRSASPSRSMRSKSATAAIRLSLIRRASSSLRMTFS